MRLAGEHAGPIDLLVTDVVMPGHGRPGAGRAAAAAAAGAEGAVPVRATPTTRSSATASWRPRCAFLQKPFTPMALAGKVREVLDGPPAEAAPADPTAADPCPVGG